MKKVLFLINPITPILLIAIVCGCTVSGTAPPAPISPQKPPIRVSQLQFSVQVGAFANLNNAVRLMEKLRQAGLDAFYFKHESGLYKVRFGNYRTYGNARNSGKKWQTAGFYEDFFIILPQDYAVAKAVTYGSPYLRDEIIKTAKRFIGTPYRWGGTSVRTGFDCSGLTMTVYRLNGLNLKRTSRNQFNTGKYVSRKNLQRGDLVFFATRGGRRVSHVGIYIGRNQFIHAPRAGKRVQIERLSNTYYSRRYMGARTYI